MSVLMLNNFRHSFNEAVEYRNLIAKVRASEEVPIILVANKVGKEEEEEEEEEQLLAGRPLVARQGGREEGTEGPAWVHQLWGYSNLWLYTSHMRYTNLWRYTNIMGYNNYGLHQYIGVNQLIGKPTDGCSPTY